MELFENGPAEEHENTLAANPPTKVKPKPAGIHRPRNILRTDHLVSRRGIAALPEIIGQTKFKGKGHELEDLKLLLFKTKHWAHRLFPGLTFEDFVTKTEHLGNKRVVKNFLNRIRTNQPLNFTQDRDLVQSDGSDNEQDNSNAQLADRKNVEQATLSYDEVFKDYIDDMRQKKKDEELVNNKNVPNDESMENFLDDDFEQDLLDHEENVFPNDNGHVLTPKINIVDEQNETS